MISLILKIPEGQTLDDLPDPVRQSIRNVLAVFVSPIPGTRVYQGYQVADCVAEVEFSLEDLAGLGMDWTPLGMWKLGRVEVDRDEDGNPIMEAGWKVLLSLLPEYINFMANEPDQTDSEGNVTRWRRPTAIKETHQYSGLPKRF